MTTAYQAEFQKSLIIRTMPDGNQDTDLVDPKDIQRLEEMCRGYRWNKSPDLSLEIGKILFAVLNGNRQTLIRALKEADNRGENLQVILKGEGHVNLPFELLYYNDFLVPSKVHLIRRVSERGIKKILTPKDRPLKVLLMACSPQDVSPVLEFEKEEDTILEVTKDLPIEIDVEDTGSLEGLGKWLDKSKYDIVHITGHADIDEKGVPFFLMENEEGLRHDVVPSMLWEKLDLNMPRLVFLSGCRTGQTPEHDAAMSFAQYLVAGCVPSVLGWGLPVTDIGARAAAVKLYYEFSRGENILEALRRTRKELFDHHQKDWSKLRLFSDGTPFVALVKREQKKRLKPGELQYTYLESSQVRVLTKGFIGRRRQIQKGLMCLRKNTEKVGLLLHGTGGLGKSCLAGKLCQRFKDHILIIVHGELNAYKFSEALKDGFFRGKDNDGLNVLGIKEEMHDKIRRLCSSTFQQRNYLIILDDFEKNLAGIKEGRPEICADAVPILEALLRFLPYSGKMTQLIITSRYTFPLTFGGKDIVREKLESIGLTSFREADERKKVSELSNIADYPDHEIRQQLIRAGLGNPRLMEYLDRLVGEVKGLDIALLLSRIKNQQEEFVQDLILRQMVEAQQEDFQTFLRRCAVYRLPVLKDGIGSLCSDLKDWDSHVEKAVRLSLMEKDSTYKDSKYWISPLLRENLFEEFEESERKKCHQVAISYYQNILSKSYEPISSAELIKHSLDGKFYEIAVEESGDRFLPYLRKSLAFKEALKFGNHILTHISVLKRDENFSKFMFELGFLHADMGNAKKAIEYYEQSLYIAKEVYGEMHPTVATILNNIGTAWAGLGDHKKAIEHYERSLSINKELYGEIHPSMANLNNIGLAWNALGEHEKALKYSGQALSIVKELYGEKHPHVAAILATIGTVWAELGDHEKAIKYYDQSLSIVKELYGEKHPDVAASLNNIATAWADLDEHERAIKYYEQALSIDKEVNGERHPQTAICLSNLGLSWKNLGEHKKAIKFYEQALSIMKELHGEKNPNVAIILHNVGSTFAEFGDLLHAKKYIQEAYIIFLEFYGNENPLTQVSKKWLDNLKVK